jgi:hypothetical protein
MSPAALAAAGAAEMPSLAQLPALSPARAAISESFWRQVRAMYAPDRSIIDFDNGNSGPAPTSVIERRRVWATST